MSKISLSDLTHVVTKGTTPTTLGMEFQEQGIPFIRVNNIHGKKLNFNTDVLYIDEKTHKKLSRSVIKPNDVLISIAGSIGRSCVVSETAPELNCNQAVCIIRCNTDKILPQYLSYWLSSETAMSQITNSKVMGVIQNLSLTQVKALKLELPSLSKQRRIAAILDKADELRQKRQQSIEKLDQLLQATFIDMFGDPITNPKGWNRVQWEQVVKIINGKNQKKVLDDNGDYPICGSGGIMGYANQWLTPANSVIIGRKGNINKPILMKENFWNVDTAFGLVPKHQKLTVDYLYWFCCFFNFETLNKTVTIPSLTKSDLLLIKMPLPDYEKQIKFSSICNAVDALKVRMQVGDLNLFQSLQNQAFNGTL